MTLESLKVLQNLERICSTSEKCSNDVLKYIAKCGLTQEESELILNSLQSAKYIDEERYITAFIRDKYRFSKWGKYKIEQALFLKKMNKQLVAKILSEQLGNEYKAMVLDELNKHRKKLKDTDPWIIKGKMARFASQRGYELASIESITNE